MPTKFVTHAAERAGVSLETAEHRWADAKKAVKKGKRKGHWYWGKVMNTFKRMMGLMETVTLKEWMMLDEELEDDSSESDFQFKMIIKALQKDGFTLNSSADDLAAEFKKGDYVYEFYCQSEVDDTWNLGIATATDGAYIWHKDKGGLSPTKLLAKIKAWDAKHPSKTVTEAVDNFPIRQRIRYWDKEVYLKGGYTMSMNDHQRGKTMFGITRLMDSSVCAIANVFQRRQAGFVYWWNVQDRTGKQIAVQGVSDGEAFDQALFKKWVTSHLAGLPGDNG